MVWAICVFLGLVYLFGRCLNIVFELSVAGLPLIMCFILCFELFRVFLVFGRFFHIQPIFLRSFLNSTGSIYP